MAAPKGYMYFYLDDEKIVSRPNTSHLADDELRLVSGIGGAGEQFKRSVDWSIVLKHGPIPCSIIIDDINVLSN